MLSQRHGRPVWRSVAGAVLAAACATAAFAQSERPIRVGAVSALAGQAGFPESSWAAASYFNAVNAAGGVNGRRIEYLSLDEGPNPQTAASAARKLVADPEVVALVGGSGLFDCPVNAATYAAAGLMSLQGASVAPECFASSHIVPMNNGPYLALENAVAFAAEHLKHQRVCLSILDLPGMGAGYRRSLDRLKPSLKSALADVAFLQPDADFADAVRDRLARTCGAVIFTGHEPAVLRWLEEAQKQGMGSIDWIFLTPAYTDQVAKAIRSPQARVYVMAEFEPWQSASLAMLDWKRVMRQGELPLSALAQGGYVSAQVFVRVARQIQGPITRATFAQALRDMPEAELSFLGMPFHVGQAQAHAPNRASLPVTWRNGHWKIAAPVWIQAPPLTAPTP
ncbi:branched-chain amino acid transport system substrate-binding protein [Hydrogenophaga palleronii]|uniref:Branched-chain amino acid transport system substrate-binding protein n=1 Tax=Hydrogenophaga palleronii TaxID=65655 RepID=A0ABU1WLQ0_9BURK|nr:ABC transporter substrate-binding protein [Hydrogenophaga palleronii]MDR7149852.1 branched-chain amino acid transport system substrate-binding protein [Hydrogenophaga palleronii]